MISYFVRREGNEDGNCDHILEVGKNLFIGEDDFEKAFGPLTSLELDLLLVSASILLQTELLPVATEKILQDGLSCIFQWSILFACSRLTKQIEEILRNLSNDAWKINLRQESGDPEKNVPCAEGNGQTLLFSGGLDSLAAAIEFGRQEKTLQLVSHITRNQTTNQAQKI